MTAEFLFYDLETWGIHPPTSWLVECAVQRTNHLLEPIEPAQRLVCQPPPECVPQGDALLVHRRTPQWACEHGMPEYEFASRLHAEFNRPNTCIIGYNNLRFDDECLRFLLYRNLFNPYTHQFKNGNSRWDVYDLVRLVYALRPELLSWPDSSMRLEDLASTNAIEQQRAHDALSDVQATMGLAQTIRIGNERLFNYAFERSRGRGLDASLKQYLGKPCLHLSPRFPRSQGHISLVYPVCCNPSISKQLYAVDLTRPIDALLECSVAEIRQLMFTSRDELPPDARPPGIKIIRLNRSPLLLNPRLLEPQRAEELGIDLDAALANYTRLAGEPSLQHKLVEVFTYSNTDDPPKDANLALYEGFVPDADYRQAGQLHKLPVDKWIDARPNWQDERMGALWLRLLGRTRTQSLSLEQAGQWQAYLVDWHQGQVPGTCGVQATKARLAELQAKHPDDQLLPKLGEYLDGMEQA